MQCPTAANTGQAGRTGPGRGSGAEQGQLEQTGSGQELSRGESEYGKPAGHRMSYFVLLTVIVGLPQWLV